MQTYQGESQLDALGDPSRRAIVALLSSEGPSSVGLLAARLPISRPAVSQHLRVLKNANLVADRPDGTRRIYALDDTGLADLHAFIDAFWRSDLDRFARFVDQHERNGEAQ
ncbi:MAG: metalloregulator ArsR/SmtB family transcription factor [Actinomycetia bacterium]|nr:metalloregulator ArsR/SmtB family transcription factor [Actinomycetes bacterium]